MPPVRCVICAGRSRSLTVTADVTSCAAIWWDRHSEKWIQAADQRQVLPERCRDEGPDGRVLTSGSRLNAQGLTNRVRTPAPHLSSG